MNQASWGRGGQQAPRGDHRRREGPPSIDTSRIRFGETVDPRLYSDIAEAAAHAVAGGQRDRNKYTQLRRFYDELSQLEGRVGGSRERFEALLPFVQMLKAKSAYAQARGLTDANFDALLRHVVDQVTGVGELRQARLFMEAFMAFYRAHGPRD